MKAEPVHGLYKPASTVFFSQIWLTYGEQIIDICSSVLSSWYCRPDNFFMCVLCLWFVFMCIMYRK